MRDGLGGFLAQNTGAKAWDGGDVIDEEVWIFRAMEWQPRTSARNSSSSAPILSGSASRGKDDLSR
jgi:hypothetical protein